MNAAYPVSSKVVDLLFGALAPRMALWQAQGAARFDGELRTLQPTFRRRRTRVAEFSE